MGALLLLADGCAVKQKPAAAPVAPGAFVTSDGERLDGPALAKALERADYVLVGETHDSPVDHKAQAALLEAVATAGRQPPVGLEMLPHTRFDAALRRFSQGLIAVDELPGALDWQRSWGYDFALYRPLFEAAQRHRLPLFGLNIDNDARKAVSRKGLEGLTVRETRALPLGIVPPLPAQRAELAAFFSSHSTMISQRAGRAKTEPQTAGPATGRIAGSGASAQGAPSGLASASAEGTARLERFLLIQSIWDSVMAEQAVKVRRSAGGPVVVLAGGGHVEKGYGIAHRLRVYDPGASVMTVMPYSGARPEGGADLFFYSPERKRFGLRFEDGNGAPLVASVVPGSPAERAGLKAGDRVLGAGGRKIAKTLDLHAAAVAARDKEEALVLDVERAGKTLRLTLE